MSTLKLPLRAGMRAGLPVVTWATSSVANASATATVSGDLATTIPSLAHVRGAAKASLLLSRGAAVRGAVLASALTELSGVRAVPGKAAVLALSRILLRASIWAPIQPEQRITYRRYGRDDYQQMLMDLLPRGRAWPRDGEDAALMLGWATEYARVEQRGWDLLNEVDPRTTKELMPEWEHFFELPGTATEEQRRKELIAEWLAGGSLSRDDIDKLLKALGITASVHYWRPFRCGVSVCGDALATEWYSTWTVTVYSPKGLDIAWLQTYLRKIAPGGDWVYVVAGW